MQDIKRIVSTDPRISAQNVIVTEYDRGLQIELDLIYVPTNQLGQLILNFDQRNIQNNQTL